MSVGMFVIIVYNAHIVPGKMNRIFMVCAYREKIKTIPAWYPRTSALFDLIKLCI